MPLLKKITVMLFCAMIAFSSCKKNFSTEDYAETITPALPDLTTRVAASVEGFVTNENGAPLENAEVSADGLVETTDEYGYFRITQANFAKSAGFVRVSKSGYFSGTRTFIPVAGGRTSIKLQLVPKIVSGSIAASTGGTVTLASGSSVTLPADAVVFAGSGNAYSGDVQVAIHWLDPSDMATTSLTMPGDLRGIDADGYLNTLTTYGMMAVELESTSGELLQIKPGMKALLRFPLPGSLISNAPAEIPMWYFEEQTGLWKEEAAGVKTGNMYEAEVGHFSWWNADVPNSVIPFTVQIVTRSLSPLSNTPVTVSLENVPNSSITFLTDSNGVAVGMMPVNSNVQVKIGSPCNPEIYNSVITTTNSPVNLGTISINAQQYSGTFTGTVNKCNGQPVTNGYVLIGGNSLSNIVEINNGNFDATMLVCPGNQIIIVAYDRETSQQSTVQNITVQAGNNSLGAIQVCNSTQVEFIRYSLDGGPFVTVNNPYHVFTADYDFTNQITNIVAFDQINSQNTYSLTFTGIDVAGPHNIDGILIVDNVYYVFAVQSVNLTEFGLINQFISGSFTLPVTDGGGAGHSLDLSFSVKRHS